VAPVSSTLAGIFVTGWQGGGTADPEVLADGTACVATGEPSRGSSALQRKDSALRVANDEFLPIEVG